MAAAALTHKCTSGNMSCLDHLPPTLFSEVFEKGLMKSDSEITDKCQPHLFIVSSKWERQWRRRVNLLYKNHCPNLPATCRLSEMLTQGWQGCLIYEQLKGGGKKGRRIKHYKSMSNIHNPEVLVVNNTKHRPNFYKCNLWQAIPSKWENLKGKKRHLLEYH